MEQCHDYANRKLNIILDCSLKARTFVREVLDLGQAMSQTASMGRHCKIVVWGYNKFFIMNLPPQPMQYSDFVFPENATPVEIINCDKIESQLEILLAFCINGVCPQAHLL